ncbi:LexA family transcriptional regulator [Phenylobacterium sp.]|uniref:LexA family transcriptional regulator n=1 Tax=Phenylobacterium sp. TaxID=1871053 RepID=UPI0025F08E93|nr:LexA family transcriptional regulator [Phenylobacterium sp.]MBX3484816.1 LexA family transcriptional regulator [Phenylobacterium sp.]MCW5760388.1 LexA family transcriptional regulator [Phenylobacterium sp.]
MDDGRAQRLRQARQDRGYDTAAAAADAFGWSRNTYASNENGNAPFSYRRAKEYAAAFGVSPEWLYDAAGPMQAGGAGDGMVPVIGSVGANPDGTVLFALGQDPAELTPVPPGGTDRARALRVAGHSMRGLADDGALIYFEDQRTAPTPDMLGQVVVIETDTDEVLVKRLLRGSRGGLYDLESIAGPMRRDARLRWAAHITAIIPPFQARRIIRGSA